MPPKFALYLNSNDSDKLSDQYQGIFTSGNVFLLFLKLTIVCPSVLRYISSNSCMLKGIVWAFFLSWHPSYKTRNFHLPDSIYEPHLTENWSVFIISIWKCGFNNTKERAQSLCICRFSPLKLSSFVLQPRFKCKSRENFTHNLNFYTRTSNWMVSIGYYLFSKHNALLFSISLILRQYSWRRTEGS